MLSPEQLTKLECDAYAFIESAKAIESYRSSLGAEPYSTAHISLKTAMMVNAGLSLELVLKLIHYKSQSSVGQRPHGHALTALFDNLDQQGKADLSKAYNDNAIKWSTDNDKPLMSAWITTNTPTPPASPDPAVRKTLRDLFEQLDDVSLFLRRYSFEDYSRSDWWIEFDVDFLAMVYGVLSNYAQQLLSPVPKQ